MVRDIVDARIKAIKYQLAEQDRQQKAQQAADEARLRAEIASVLEEVGGDEVKAQIFVRVRQIIAEVTRVDKSEVILDSHILHNLGADELDAIELALALEEEFEIEMPEELLGTVRELLLFVHEKISP
jgi:acyl carrier protein